MRTTGATMVVAAALRLPHSVPNMPVNSLIPTGAVLTCDRVNVSAKRNSFHARSMLRMPAVAMPGAARQHDPGDDLHA